MTDLHCHILPGIDDGAETVEQALELLRMEQAQGVTNLVLTPHFDSDEQDLEEFLQLRKEAWDKLKAGLRSAPELQGLKLRVGAEVFYNDFFMHLDLRPLCFTNTDYLLLELPTTVLPPNALKNIGKLLSQGYKVILAHVERYPYLLFNPGLLYQLVNAGCLLQCNAEALLEQDEICGALLQLIDWNLISLVSSDVHNKLHRPPNLDQAVERLKDTGKLEPLLENTTLVFQKKELTLPKPYCPKRTVTGKWK